jgi:hypothetical protein
MTDSTGAPITGPACTAAILTDALANVHPDTVVVLQIPGYPWLWRIGDIHLTAFSEHHHVDEATIVLPAVYVVIDADKVIRHMPGDENSAPDADAGAAPDAAQKVIGQRRWPIRFLAAIRGLLRRCRKRAS